MVFNRTKISRLILLVSLSTLTGCYNFWGIDRSEDHTDRDSDMTYGLAGTVTGLSGSVTLKWADQQRTFDANGGFTIAGAISNAQDVMLSLENPPSGQACEITTAQSFTNVSADISGVRVVCNNLASELIPLRINVRNYFNGDLIPSAAVAMSWEDNGVAMQRTATTGDDGAVEIMIPTFVGRLSVSADNADFGENSTIINSTSGNQALSANVQLLPVNASQSFAAAAGGNLAVDNVQVVDIPPAALVTADGTAYSGSVKAEITLIDPSSDPNIMPGDFTTVDTATGVVASIESFGAVNVTFESEAGEALDLADGQTATIRIPVAEGATNPPSTIPLYYFDETLGRWIEEGQATLTTSGGVAVYEGTVSHFTTWNADRVFETVTIAGCVVDAAGNAVANTAIRTRGSDYIGTASTIANASGEFVVAARLSSRVFLSAISGTQSRTITVNTDASNQTLGDCLVVDEAASTITLSWGENPRDLDTHFSGPADAAGDSSFHIYFGNKTANLGDTTLYLDVDDTSSFGPEILTIPTTFPFPGTYRYSVYKFSGSSDIQASPARVELNLNGETSIFSPPEGTPTDCWVVFDLIVAEGGAVSVVSQRNNPELAEDPEPYGWEGRLDCTNSEANLSNSGTALRRANTPSPFRQHIESKHYSE